MSGETASIYLCQLDEIDDPGSKGFSRVINGVDTELFVVRRQGRVVAYENHCPHTGAPLEWQPDQFLDFENRFIQCAIHGALFTVSEGLCIRGPCAGLSLEPLELQVENGKIYMKQ